MICYTCFSTLLAVVDETGESLSKGDNPEKKSFRLPIFLNNRDIFHKQWLPCASALSQRYRQPKQQVSAITTRHSRARTNPRRQARHCSYQQVFTVPRGCSRLHIFFFSSFFFFPEREHSGVVVECERETISTREEEEEEEKVGEKGHSSGGSSSSSKTWLHGSHRLCPLTMTMMMRTPTSF